VRQFEVEIQRDWVLITYDIPARMDTTRKRVIRALRNMGALRHTDSVYYLPVSEKAIQLAETLPGEVYVWRSSLTSDTQAKRLTQEYYNKIIEGVKKLHERIDDLERNFPILTLEAKKQRLNYSIKLFNSLKVAANNIGLLMYEQLADVGQRLDSLTQWLVEGRGRRG